MLKDNLKAPWTGKHLNEQDREVHQLQHELHNMDNQDLPSHAHELDVGIKAVYGVLVQMLQRMEEADSLSQAIYLTLYQNTAAQNTFYNTNNSTIIGVCRGIILSGSGNITLRLNAPNLSPKGFTTIGTFPVNGVPFPVPFRFPIKWQSYFSASTDSSSNGIVSVSAWVEPVTLTGKDMYTVFQEASI